MVPHRILSALLLATASLVLASPANAAPPSTDQWPALSSSRGDSYANFVDVGDTLTLAPLAWSGAPTSIVYQWQRCDSHLVCTDLLGTASSSYTVVTSDLGFLLHLRIGASNADGTTWKDAYSPYVGAPALDRGIALTKSGGGSLFDGIQVGDTLVLERGTWFGSPTAWAYSWHRCRPGLTGCSLISGATDSSYTVTASDVGYVLLADVTATNTWGSRTSGMTSPSAVGVVPVQPKTWPQVSSNRATYVSYVAIGDVLTVSEVEWSGSPSVAYQWQRCDAASVCAPIDGATSRVYTVVASDRGFALHVLVTATNGTDTNTATVWAGQAVGAPGLAQTEYPAVSSSRGGYVGYVAVGDILTVSSNGAWLGAPTSFSYQWRRHPANDWNRMSTIAGATGTSYTVTADDVGYQIEVLITASNEIGSSTATGWGGYPVGAPGLAPNSWPRIVDETSGSADDPQVGDVLRVDRGTWRGDPIFAVRWARMPADSWNFTDIPGATGDTYTVTAADTGWRIAAVVTATNAYGSTTSQASTYHAVGAPRFVAGPRGLRTTGPNLASYFRVGDHVTADPGLYEGTPTFTYQWQRCDAAGNSCADVSGATGATYDLTAEDAGHVVVAVVTIANGVASVVDRLTTGGPVGAPGIDDRYPTLSSSRGTTSYVAVGDVLTVNRGTWFGDPTSYAYRWMSCNVGCTTVASGDSPTYTVTAGDLGSSLQVQVTARNAVGSGSAWTPQTNPVGAPGVDDLARPQLSSSRGTTGYVGVGDVLTTTRGTWLGAPTSFSFQWYRCASRGMAPCAPIEGATTDTWTVAASDLGHYLRVDVTATNDLGSGRVSSWMNADAAGVPGIGGVYPSISNSRGPDGYVGVGDRLTGAAGTWLGSPSTFRFQWMRCSASGSWCSDIAGATDLSYTVTADDRGSLLELTISAINDVGTGSYTARSSAPVDAPAPTAGGYPQFESSRGTTAYIEPGDTLAVTRGTWLGEPTTFTYQWARCAYFCIDIPGATGASYEVADGDVGNNLDVRVTASNDVAASQWYIWSPRVGAPAPKSDLDYPSVANTRGAGYARYVGVGDTLEVALHEWYGEPAFTYQWERCVAGSSDCVRIAGAAGATYTVTAADLGRRLAVEVTASNRYGSLTTMSGRSRIVGVPGIGFEPGDEPVFTSTRGDPDHAYVGETLSLTSGTWLGQPTSITIQWSRCGPTACTPIEGATGWSYVVTPADRGLDVIGDIRATNDVGVGYAGWYVVVFMSTAFTTAAVSPDPVAGWDVEPTVTLTARDDYGPGVDFTEYRLDGGAWTRYTTAFAVTADGAHTVVYRSRDLNGDAGPSETLRLKVDATAPTVTVELPPQVVLGSAWTAAVTCADAGSGIATCVGDSAPLETSTVGTHTFTATATDVAGNRTTAEKRYTVVWPWQGFIDLKTTVNAGSSVPLKFSLGGDRGLQVLAAGSPSSRPVECATGLPAAGSTTPVAAAGQSSIAYDALAGAYTYVWKTDAAWAGTCRELRLALADGSFHDERFTLR